MVILGIDPGLATVGYGLIEYRNGMFRTIAYGAITTKAHTKVENRLAIIYSDLAEIIDKYRPDEMAIEEIFFNDNAKTAIAVSEARGVLLLCARHKNVPISATKLMFIISLCTNKCKWTSRSINQTIRKL